MYKTFRHFYLYSAVLLLLALLIMFQDRSVSIQLVHIWLRQSSITGVLAIGLTFITLCGYLDISVGAIMSLAAAICVYLFRLKLFPSVLVFILAIAIAALCCCLNGCLAEWLRMPYFILSFVTMIVLVGLVGYLTDGTSIWITHRFLFDAFGTLLPAVMWIVLLIASQFLLQSTYVGQYFYAIGDNEPALQAIGVNTLRYKLVACLLCGAFAGMAGILMMLRTSASVANNNIDSIFQAMTVLAMSGLYQKGARPNMINILLSTIALNCCMTCMTIHAIIPMLQNIIIGIIFMGALVLSRIDIPRT